MAASSSLCHKNTISLSTPSRNSRRSLLRFPASGSSNSSKYRLSIDSHNNNRDSIKLKASATSAAPAMDQATSSSPAVPAIVEVDLGDQSYPIYITAGILDQSQLLQRHVHGKQVLVVTNTTMSPLYLDKTIWALTDGNPSVKVEAVILPDGEQFKDMAIETGLGYGQSLHGDAVAAGTVMAVDMSHRLGWIDSPLVKRVREVLERAKLPNLNHLS